MARTVVNVSEKTWVLVASNVTGGFVRLPESEGAFKFWYTIRNFGDTAPILEGDGGKSLPLFEDSRNEEIASSVNIDVYVWAQNNDKDATDSTKVIVDL